MIDLLSLFVFLLLASLTFLLGRRWRRAPTPKSSAHLRTVPPVLGRYTSVMATVMGAGEKVRAEIQSELVRAGYYHKHALDNFLATRNVALMLWCLCLAGGLAVGLIPVASTKLLAVALVVAIVIFGVPRVVLSLAADARSSRIQFDLPDALDMLTMIMSGGLTMQQSLSRVIRELEGSHPDLACELSIILRQTDTGSFDQAMEKFAQRVDLPDVTALSALMKHNHRIGGRFVDALREFADSIRRSRQIKAEERGNKAAVKILLPVVFFLAPPIYILLLGPALLELRDFVKQENRPGGVLVPSVSSAANPNTSISDSRPFAAAAVARELR